MHNIKRKNLIIYELNEVPKKIIDYYVKIKPNSNLNKLIIKGTFIETTTDDIGELHPWSSWPTVHRGVDNSMHKIKFINQNLEIAKNYPPIWELLIKEKISIGIFGSLQSYPPIKSKYVKFYVPDTFAPKPDSIPQRLTNFQRLNLELTMRNKAYYRTIRFKDFYDFFKLFYSLKISLKVIFKLFIHLLCEIIEKRFKKRRSLLQPVLGFDIYKKLVLKYEPSFSTFFTNHVAGIMHRYWRDSFPEEFENKNPNSNDEIFNKISLIKAMDIVDSQIGFLHKLQEKRGGEIWILSAIGQEAVQNKFKKDLIIDRNTTLYKFLGLPKNSFTFLPSMHPDFNIKCKSNYFLKKLRDLFSNIKDIDGNLIFKERYKPTKNTINFITESTDKIVETEEIYFLGKKYPLKELGLKLINRDIGTAYHNKKGIFISNRKNTFNNSELLNTKFFYNYVRDYFLE